MAIKYFRQHPVRGGRKALPACVLKDIFQAVERAARRHRVSRSFVIAVALAHAFGIDEQEQFPDQKEPKS